MGKRKRNYIYCVLLCSVESFSLAANESTIGSPEFRWGQRRWGYAPNFCRRPIGCSRRGQPAGRSRCGSRCLRSDTRRRHLQHEIFAWTLRLTRFMSPFTMHESRTQFYFRIIIIMSICLNANGAFLFCSLRWLSTGSARFVSFCGTQMFWCIRQPVSRTLCISA